MNENVADYLALGHLKHRKLPTPKRVLVFIGTSIAMVISMVFTTATGVVFALYQSTTDDYPPLAEQISQHGSGITTVYDRNGEQLGLLSNTRVAVGNRRQPPWSAPNPSWSMHSSSSSWTSANDWHRRPARSLGRRFLLGSRNGRCSSLGVLC